MDYREYNNQIRQKAAPKYSAVLYKNKLLVKIIALLESVNTSACINKLLFACEERMALGTDINAQIALC